MAEGLKFLKSARELVRETVRKINRFQTGEDKPVKTPYWHMNKNMLGGFFPSDILGICATSGGGKSYTLQKIEEGIFDKELNPDCDDYFLVRANWEMSVFKLMLRKLSRRLKKSMAEILTNVISEEEKHKWTQIRIEEESDRIFYCEDPLTPDDFREMVINFMESEIPNSNGRKYKDAKRVIFTIDHLALTKGADKKKAIDLLVEYLNELRKIYGNINFIILSQLNREIEFRRAPKDHAPNRGDLYQTDFPYQICDVMVCVHIPRRLGIYKYMLFNDGMYSWLDKYKVAPSGKTRKQGVNFETEGLIFWHYIKIRDMDLEADNQIQDLFIETFPSYADKYKDEDVDTVVENAPSLTDGNTQMNFVTEGEDVPF